MKKYIQWLAVAAFAVGAFALSGCMTVPGVIQDKTKPIQQNGYTVVAEEVSATEPMVMVFGFAASDVRGSLSRRLYQKCLKQAPGADALIEFTTDVKQVNLGVVNVMWYTMTGTAVKTK